MKASMRFSVLWLLTSVCLINVFIYLWNLPKEMARWQQEQRKQSLWEMCDAEREAFPEDIEDVPNRELENLIVDDKHGIIYCYIPKIACTNWKRVMFVLKQGEPYQDPAAIDGEKVHNYNMLTHLSSFPRPEQKVRLNNYTKFLFVRHPFVRLISAYRDKLHNDKFKQSNEHFYQYYGREILRRYGKITNPPKSLKEALVKGLHPSFRNFIQYLLDPQTEKAAPFEPHWRQMYRLCHPCLIKYDFVGHQETLKEDTEQLLRILNLEDIKFPPSYDNMTSSSWMSDWLRTVPLEARRKLYKLYEMDFKLFGYEKPDSVLNE